MRAVSVTRPAASSRGETVGPVRLVLHRVEDKVIIGFFQSLNAQEGAAAAARLQVEGSEAVVSPRIGTCEIAPLVEDGGEKRRCFWRTT